MNNYKIKSINNQSIYIYNEEAFKGVLKASEIAKNTLLKVEPFIKEGISTEELNQICHDYIVSQNAYPAPLDYNGFPKSICTSVNHVVCHGIPSENKILKNGDIINIDVTAILNGYYGDTSKTYPVGNISHEAQKLLDVTEKCLNEAIKILKPSVTLGDIGYTIENIAHSNGFSVVEIFCGHGIGVQFHQSPNVLHYGQPNSGMKLEEGMIFTIEPMINAGKKDVKILKDNWTAVTKDKSLSAQFEHTIGITKDGYQVFTK